MLAVHAANAALSGTSEASFESNLGYSGEQWDTSLRMQNLRARAYDPRNGRFIGLDAFAGNMQAPQSLHKYAYVHGDPIQLIDPNGLEGLSISAAITLSTTISIGISLAFSAILYKSATDVASSILNDTLVKLKAIELGTQYLRFEDAVDEEKKNGHLRFFGNCSISHWSGDPNGFCWRGG